MQRFIALAMVLASPLLLTAGGDNAAKELKVLKGKWKAVALEAGGKELPKDIVPAFTYEIGADGKATGQVPGGGEFRFTVTVDPKKKPRTIDVFHESGAEKGKKQFGIYKLEGDRWTVCITHGGAEAADRPKDFTTKDSKNVLFVFERAKAEKKP